MSPGRRNRRPQVAIIGASEADPDMLALAEQAGAVVARVGAALVTGGRAGVMAAASKRAAPRPAARSSP